MTSALATAPQGWLVAEWSIDPTAFTWFGGRSFVFRVSEHEPWPWLRALGVKRGTLATWGSVVTSACDLAISLGCDPIVFAGTDLAYTAGQTYARGSAHDTYWEDLSPEEVWQLQRDQHRLVTTRDLSGGTTRTAPHFVAIRDWLVERTAGAGRRIINATPRGILVAPHIARQPLDTALAGAKRLATEEIFGRLRAAHAASSRATSSVRAGVAALLEGHPRPGDDPTGQFAIWHQFAVGATPVDRIVAALVDAGRLLGVPDRIIGAADTAAAIPDPVLSIVAARTHAADGLITYHACDFIQDGPFRAAYGFAEQMSGYVEQRIPTGLEWRIHTGLWAVDLACRIGSGSVVDCGVDAAFLFNAVRWHLAGTNGDTRCVHVHDGADGPAAYLWKTGDPLVPDTGDGHATSLPGAQGTLSGCTRLPTPGASLRDVLEGLPREQIAFLHIGMGNVVHEVEALEQLWARVNRGGLVLFNSYAHSETYRPLRQAVDEFAARQDAPVLTLATGQGLIIKP